MVEIDDFAALLIDFLQGTGHGRVHHAQFIAPLLRLLFLGYAGEIHILVRKHTFSVLFPQGHNHGKTLILQFPHGTAGTPQQHGT